MFPPPEQEKTDSRCRQRGAAQGKARDKLAEGRLRRSLPGWRAGLCRWRLLPGQGGTEGLYPLPMEGGERRRFRRGGRW